MSKRNYAMLRSRANAKSYNKVDDLTFVLECLGILSSANITWTELVNFVSRMNTLMGVQDDTKRVF